MRKIATKSSLILGRRTGQKPGQHYFCGGSDDHTHHITVTNRFGNPITAPVVYIKDLGSGKAECHLETNFHIEMGYDYPAVYSVPGHDAKGRWVADSREFTERHTYIYRGEFRRT